MKVGGMRTMMSQIVSKSPERETTPWYHVPVKPKKEKSFIGHK